MNLVEQIKSKLKEKNLTVAVAESCTGGLVSSMLTDISGSSHFIKLNLITYSNEAKEKMLKVSPETLLNHGAVSEETAIAMAKGIKELAGCDIGLSTTGIAGPTGATEEKPVGLMYTCVYTDSSCKVKKIVVSSEQSRPEIKLEFAEEALKLLLEQI